MDVATLIALAFRKMSDNRRVVVNWNCKAAKSITKTILKQWLISWCHSDQISLCHIHQGATTSLVLMQFIEYTVYMNMTDKTLYAISKKQNGATIVMQSD